MGRRRPPADRERRRHGELGGRELGGELMLLDDLRIRPAARPIELEHQLPLAGAELVDAVLVAVEGEQPPVRREPERGGGIEHHLGCQPGERLQVAAAGFVYHRSLMKHGAILITGGAGYIGSHVALQLRARAERVVVLDDLSRGFRQAVLDVPLVVGNVGDRDTVRAALDAHGVDTVMHFAACTVVPESVGDPLKYYLNNTCATRSLLQCCLEGEVRHFVFSPPRRSTASRPQAWPPRTPRPRPSIPTAPPSSCRSGCSRPWPKPRRFATCRCATSTWRARIPAAASARRPRMRRCSSRSPARRRSASEPRSRSSAPTIRRPMARASATTFTSRIWRPRTSTPSSTCARGAARPRLTSATDTVTACGRFSPASSGCRASPSRCARSRAAPETRRRS